MPTETSSRKCWWPSSMPLWFLGAASQRSPRQLLTGKRLDSLPIASFARSQEALFFRIMNVLRSPKPPPAESCRAALVDFDTPLSDALFADSDDEGPPTGACGGQYQFAWLSLEDIEGIRQQARAWSTCWPEP